MIIDLAVRYTGVSCLGFEKEKEFVCLEKGRELTVEKVDEQ